MAGRSGIVASLALLLFAFQPSTAIAACEVIKELSPNDKLETLHRNLLCLHERLEALIGERSVSSDADVESGYILLSTPPNVQGTGSVPTGGPTNPCKRTDQASQMMCVEALTRSFQRFCADGDCVAGFGRLRPYMTENWKQYLDHSGTISGLRDDNWLQVIPSQPDIFVDNDKGQSIDMLKFFQQIKPTDMFNIQQ